MSKQKGPMLAFNKIPDLDSLTYPMFASAKLDGVRCIIKEGEIVSRTLKPIRNKNVKAMLQMLADQNKNDGWVFDGELYSHMVSFQEIVGCVMSHDKPLPPGLFYAVIDMMRLDEWNEETSSSFSVHYKDMHIIAHAGTAPHIRRIKQTLVHDADEARHAFDVFLGYSYEGLMLRCPTRGYKHGRTTLKENWLFKFKNWLDYDGEIIEVIEKKAMKEGIERKKDAMGHLEHSHKKDDYEQVGTMGALRVRLDAGREVKIGTWKGLTDETRQSLWDDRENIVGRWVRFKGQAAGIKDLPRIPCNLEFRDEK